MELTNTSCISCKNCAICVYHILSKYNLLTDAYHVIGLAYKFLLTLSFSQVACERTFSTLKFVKNRLRTTLTQEHLEAFMLMSTETEWHRPVYCSNACWWCDDEVRTVSFCWGLWDVYFWRLVSISQYLLWFWWAACFFYCLLLKILSFCITFVGGDDLCLRWGEEFSTTGKVI